MRTDYYIDTIKLVNYKNLHSIQLNFHKRWNAVLGMNGMGKTNLLDALYYACLGKSYFAAGDRNVVSHGCEFFRIESEIISEETTEKVVCKVLPGQVKEISVGGKKSGSLSEHVGRFPCVMIAPMDIHNLLEGSEERRNLMNQTLIQVDKKYTEAMVSYNRLLRQRNALLKSFQDGRYFDKDLLEALSVQMANPTQYIYEKRKHLAGELSFVFTSMYQRISGGREECKVIYRSQLDKKSFSELMAENLERDRILGRTHTGVHKDDLDLIMNDEPVKPFGSQGQLKSFVMALKLAQFMKMKEYVGRSPVLILDDIFDKLDAERVSFLLEILQDEDFGQIFISDKDVLTIPEMLDRISSQYRIFVIHEGTLKYSQEK